VRAWDRVDECRSGNLYRETVVTDMPKIAFFMSISILATALSSCTTRAKNEAVTFTLYSTNFPESAGRSGVATFNLSDSEDINQEMCWELAKLLADDFEKRKIQNDSDKTRVIRYWCEKGTYR